MKKFYMTIVALLCSFAAMAQDAVENETIIYVPDISVPAGEESVATVSVCMKNANPVRNTEVKFAEFPEGIDFVYNDETGEIAFTRNADRLDLPEARNAMKNQRAGLAVAFPFTVLTNGTILFGSKSSGYFDDANVWHSVIFKGNDGEIYSFEIIIPATVKADVYKVPFTYTLPGPVSNPNEMPKDAATANTGELVINVGGTGIHSINAADSNAPIYNVAGQRVSKAQKGIFIQNGKKVAVK